MLDIDWSKVPEGYDWVAQDKCGIVYAYMDRPVISYESGSTGTWRSPCHRIRFIEERKKNPNFHKTLTKRPEK